MEVRCCIGKEIIDQISFHFKIIIIIFLFLAYIYSYNNPGIYLF